MAEGPLAIALLTHSVNPRGGVVHVLELGRALQSRGHRVTVLAPAAPGERFFRDTGCRVELATVAPGGGGLADSVVRRIAALRGHLAELLRRESFDVLHAHDGIGANALADLQAAGLIDSYRRTVHHVDRFQDAQVQAWEERSIRAAAQVLAVSATWCTRLREHYGIEAAQVSNGVDLARYTPRASARDAEVAARHGITGQPVVLAVGGIEARKNTRGLLQAMVLLRQRWPGAQLVVAGGASLLDHDGEARAFHTEAAAAGLAIGRGEAIVLTGPVADDDMPCLYRRADGVAMPSWLEGFGLAALEGLACGAPVVVSRIAPFTEHFADTDVDWADPAQPASIAQALQRAVARGRHGEAPAVCARFSWSASAARHEALYRTRLPRGTPMPAMHYRLRWPDASVSSCYSPSLVIKDYFAPGERYAVPEFLRRLREATQIASDRVAAKYGYACSRAIDQLAVVEAQAARYADRPDARIEVLEFTE